MFPQRIPASLEVQVKVPCVTLRPYSSTVLPAPTALVPQVIAALFRATTSPSPHFCVQAAGATPGSQSRSAMSHLATWVLISAADVAGG